MVGKTVQHYHFLEKLGSGGMGEIFKAHDTRLNRFVAVKVLSGERASDPERRRRFLQEAQAASALNHPNIVTIHDILGDGPNALMVMEWVQGKTLIDLIPKGGLRVPQVLKYGVQMADALQIAHNAGIVHRDLKPGNVMVTESGLVKILDFGLAKLTDASAIGEAGDSTQSMRHAPLTVEGSILGTVSYMSPEQAQGRKVDGRSDIFSFGLVLYEMATGVRAFAGDSALSTLSSILRDEVRSMIELAPEVPPALDQVVHRCLRKNPDHRWQSMKDVQVALTALKRESDSGSLYGLRAAAEPAARAVAAAAAASQSSRDEKRPAKSPATAGQSVRSETSAPFADRPDSATRVETQVLSAPIVASMAGGLLFVLTIGIGSWWWFKHQHQAAVPAAQAPIAPRTPEPSTTAPQPEQVLTNDTIIEMVQAKVATAVILSEIKSSKTDFNLSASEVIRLTKSNVPASVIEAMRDPSKIPASATAPQVARQPQSAPLVPGSPPPPPPVQTATSSRPVVPPPPVVEAPASTPVIAPPLAAGPATHPVTVANGMPFPIVLAQDIPSAAEEGQLLRFTALRDFKIGDDVIVPKGASVSGAIAEGAKKKFIFNSGKMTLRLIEAAGVTGNKIRVRATVVPRADGTSTRPVETGVKKPRDLAAARGTEYFAYIDGDQSVPARK